jgi:multiple sugar transport system substrate-binding protein
VTSIGAVTALLLVGCTAQGGSGSTSANGTYSAPVSSVKATIAVATAGSAEDAALYTAATKRFNQKYPNVTVKNNFSNSASWVDYINKILASVASGDAPDVITMATEGVEFGLSKDLFLPLNNYMKQDKEAQALVKDIDPRLVDGFKKNGNTYLLPNNWNAMVIYYNKRIFKEAGIPRPSDNWTIQDFVSIAKKLTTGSGDNKVYGFGIPSFTWALVPWMYSHGASMASPDLKKPTLDSKAMVETMQFLQDLVIKDRVAPQIAGSDPYQLFPAQKIAMTGGGSFMIVPLASAGFSDYDVLPWPKDKSATSVFGASGVSVYKNSKNADLAWEYVKELAGQKSQMDNAKARTNNPTTRTAATSSEFLATPPEHASLLYDAINIAKPIAAPTFYTTLEPAFQRALQQIMSGTDPYTALHKANEEVKASIANG